MTVDCGINSLVGLTLNSVVKESEFIIFTTDCGRVFKMGHFQDCCEDVHLVEEDETLDRLRDLIGAPILVAEEVDSGDTPPENDCGESYTWTFYKLANFRSNVTMRWFGSSNGFYGEGVDFFEVKQ